MKTEIFVILEHCSLEDDPYYGMDFIESTQGYAFDDYEKARLWVLAWVRDYNKNMKKTIKDENGKFVPSDEPVLVEVRKTFGNASTWILRY